MCYRPRLLPPSPTADTSRCRTDNIAPPVAACLGDLVTLLLLGAVSTVNIILVNTPFPWILIILLSGAAVGWTILTRRNTHVRHLLLEGWVPLFAAMVISCGTGIVLDLFVSRYEGFALLAAVISGELSHEVLSRRLLCSLQVFLAMWGPSSSHGYPQPYTPQRSPLIMASKVYPLTNIIPNRQRQISRRPGS